MNQPESSHKTYRYAGFISYSQKDKRWARRIHRALEAYRLPTGIAQEAAAGKRLGRFFRDDDELAGEPSLGNALESALDGAASLIVVCSPNSARSKWVDAEIARFKSRGPSARVFAVIIDGQPDHPDPEIMCFAPSMLRKAGLDGQLSDEADEPLAPDVRREPFNRLIARLVAGLLGLQFDTLWQREQRRIRRRRILIGSGILFAAVASGVGIKLTLDAEQETKIARLEQLRAESGNLATAAQTAMDEGRVNDALVAALNALPEDLNTPDRPLTSSAIAALKRVMTANHAAGIISRFEQPLEQLRLLSNGNLAARLGNGQLRVVNPETSELIWQAPQEERLDWLAEQDIAASSWTEESPDSNGIYQLQHRVIVRDLLTGSILRQLESDDRNWWVGPAATLSPSGALLMVSPTLKEKRQLAIWRVPEVGKSVEPETIDQLDGPELGADDMLTGAFINEQTLMLNWGKTRRNIAVWNVGSGQLQNISTADTPLACEAQQLDPDPQRTDRVSLSADRTLISHARPILNGAWCISLWQATDGSALPPLMLEEKNIGSVDAISTDRIVVSRSASSWQPAAIWTRDGDELPLPNCDAMRVSFLGHDVVDENHWLINPDKGFAACINRELIHTYLGQTFADQRTLHGHNGNVGALAFDAINSRLYSGGDDGSLRAWDFSDLPRNLAVDGNVLSMTSHGDRVGLIFRDAQDRFQAQVFAAVGSPISATIPFELNIPASDIPQGQRLNLDLFFLAEARSIALLESWDCGFMGCPSGLVNRLSIHRVSDGGLLAHIDDLRTGKFLANIPVAHALSHDGQHLALVKRDGSIVEVDALGGEILRRHAEAGWTANDVAYTDDVLWVLSSDGAQEADERLTHLTRIAADGSATIATEQRAQSGQLHGSSAAAGAGTVALAEYSLAHITGIPNRYQLLSADTDPRTLSLADGQENITGRLESVTFHANGSRMLLLFGKGDDAVLDVDIQSATASAFLPSIGSGSLDPWRVDDPLARVVLSVDDDSLLLLGLPDQPELCPALSGHNADAAAFSPDGALLALADSGKNKLEVYDLESCSRVYSASVSVRHNGLIRFAGPSSLWTINSRGQVRRVELATDSAALHQRARQLRAALGL